ncbi:hypothetical protein TBR22_A30090 [Luteitalea sp. TBR-22]|uniref:hypothetical protein n=1 Tax=Luteitalea sp. TBR-22 TaxID=2802971 RepID=UPI001AF734B6|nr:hypothetical protein [Luteitalea sp. TBR-22]BCS33782.1 hypothetical protein TBR22_A30090 [Luteitalea sp. TBR-22]
MTAAAILATLALGAQAPATPATIPSPDVQIAGAVQAAPADQRATATVIGFDAQGKHTTLRRGTGSLVCLADDPGVAEFSVACYHKDLEPFMARGRELASAGSKGRGPAGDVRYKEIEAGTLKMPAVPTLLTIVQGTGFDAAAGTVTNSYTRWVIYTPGATAESTGLPLTPAPGAPWLMFPGTPGAHIMISPARPK